ncbi:hypothetical protein VCRA2119O147_960006 [Vibrio crassostreae]|uniref:GIY-YIG nuclease family protein n=1 Tax=Vibrio crassostreae TaxID=246167 RepID=UPI0005E131C1|nr:GIY-YIG nuclease family protein [Vibrio crassostreae]TCL18571.1 GIY-YIG catalytic domain-containing protein [Vibrio crassostreae]TCT94071.1 GIY-YIG catalytic domain-containing protein [Vibrio crassostreae]CAK1809987.1 hypothetical protein VCRA2112O187_150015 [Vibrio crassostreae]CAK1943801.1 hypothetical protein VCRA2113O207_290029 [Vibrio crassostreae]CAK1950515.1 hypothetical protein VCRA2118O239_260063 [Vibrio crassostreae]
MITVENHQIIYLKRRFYEHSDLAANYWDKYYSPASYTARLNGEFRNLAAIPDGCLFKKAKLRHQKLTLKPDKVVNDLSMLPDSSGVYALISKDKECLYVGASKNLRKRVPEHKRWGSHVRFDEVFYFAYWLADEVDCFKLEKVVLVALHPKKNVQYRYDILPKWCNSLSKWDNSVWRC